MKASSSKTKTGMEKCSTDETLDTGCCSSSTLDNTVWVFKI